MLIMMELHYRQIYHLNNQLVKMTKMILKSIAQDSKIVIKVGVTHTILLKMLVMLSENLIHQMNNK